MNALRRRRTVVVLPGEGCGMLGADSTAAGEEGLGRVSTAVVSRDILDIFVRLDCTCGGSLIASGA